MNLFANFALKGPDSSFVWTPYLEGIRQEFEPFGLHLQIRDRSELPGAVREAFIKEESFGQVIQLTYERTRADSRVVQIKLEVDTNPPLGAEFESHVLPFPLPFSVTSHKLSSMFAGKINALLTREYDKGRDWFDFIWYRHQGVAMNLVLLRESLLQFGYPVPAGQISLEWLKEKISGRIQSLDWMLLKQDLRALLRERDQATMNLWDEKFFSELVQTWWPRFF